MTTIFHAENDRGSLWHRWDPHIHGPGTVLNDQYTGAKAWEYFLEKIESADPPVRALGMTDYYGIHCYEKILEFKREGRLKGVGLIFPNVELRLSIETSKASGINLHLLFDPEPVDHIEQIRRFLREFEFGFRGNNYRCEPSDLIRLGREYGNALMDDKEALSVGANQFKVSFDQLRKAWSKNEWVRNHALIAVSGGEKDGTSGLRDEHASFAAIRKEIEGFSHVIFSSNPKQISYWLGQGADSIQKLESECNGRKPCLHGSDAHGYAKVGAPDGDRFCWIKGDLAFESLRQTCIEPGERVFIGKEPPRGALQGNTISDISISEAPWLSKQKIPLNPGFVAIIGARGSGKTALADLIAAGGSALRPHHNERSFVYRAREYLGNSEATLHWESGETTSNSLGDIELEDLLDNPHVQYLSQQFVDQLCSTERLDDALVQEIEKVIFNAHHYSDRMGASDFRELLDKRIENIWQRRERQKHALVTASLALTEERARKDSLKALEQEREEKRHTIEKDKKDKASLISQDDVERTKRYDEVSAAVETKRRNVEEVKRRLRSLQNLKVETFDYVRNVVPGLIAGWRLSYLDANLTDSDWKNFQIEFTGPVERLLNERIEQSKTLIKQLEGAAESKTIVDQPVESSLIPIHATLSEQPLYLLELEQARLAKIVAADVQKAKRYSALTEKIGKTEIALKKVEDQIARANEADNRIRTLREERRAAYESILALIVKEEQELIDLYGPIKRRIEAASGSLAKLSFYVRRTINIEAWAEAGEDLLDLRKNGPFKGRGALLAKARGELLPAWLNGSAAEASQAMFEFVKASEVGLREHMPEDAAFRTWASQVSDWLYGTDHISVGYGLRYDGIDIERLSPGTRGIVLLLLYLAIDEEDERPLIIDQPEENLDPQSVFNELVGCFREAKRRRQIIIVTHNANLVVNTDADQVIVASCGPHQPGELPTLSYESGGLENLRIRKHVCNVLEGGERAFKERAKRLRVELL